jgi:hypothetical protein
VRGLVQLAASQQIVVELVSANHRVLTTTVGFPGQVGWEAGLTIPPFVSGAASLQATIRDEGGVVLAQDTAVIALTLDTEATDRYLALYRPLPGETAVSGFNLFFDGRAQRPVNNSVTIAIWADDCQTQVARQSFVLRGSGYWQGYVIAPANVSGAGCAIASFGTPGEAEWREVQVPITIYAAEDAAARGVRIANPSPGSMVTAGQELLLNGVVFNVVDESLLVSILLENGRIVSESFTSPDYWGYWELTTFLPFDVEGAAQITVSTGDPNGDDYAEAVTTITIDPAPTPTPFPIATPVPSPTPS